MQIVECQGVMMHFFLITQNIEIMELSELRTNEDVADYLRQLILELEAGQKTPQQVNAGVAAAKALTVELNRPSGGWGSTLSSRAVASRIAAEQPKPASRSKAKGKAK